jgi:biotin transport system substrate-specific component
MDVVTVKKEGVLVEVGIAVAGSCALALLSQVAIPLHPIPITLQTLGIFLLGGVLGSRRAFYSVLGYLVQGSCGLPVFAGGVANPWWICTPQAGFLISFLGAAYLVGKGVEKKPQAGFFYLLGILTLGQMVMFAIGGTWLAYFLGWKKAYLVGIAPFFIGAGLKIASCTLALRFFRRRS